MARNQTAPSAPAVAYAVASCGCGDGDGMVYSLREGDTWDANDKVVRQNPGLFSDQPTRLLRSI